MVRVREDQWLHPDDELPLPVAPHSVVPSLLHAAALLAGTLILAYAVVFLIRWAITPIPSTPSLASLTTPAPPTFPSELLQMAVALSTSVAPTPVPATATPTHAMQPTPRPVAVCLTSTPKGEVCSQPKPPLPTPTPIPLCPVKPEDECVSLGGPVRWLPTATPVRGFGVNN